MVRLGIYPRPVMVRRDVAGMINLKLCLGRDRAVVRIADPQVLGAGDLDKEIDLGVKMERRDPIWRRDEDQDLGIAEPLSP